VLCVLPGGINPDVAIESYTMNITTVDGFDAFKASVTQEGDSASRVDLILSCVDNYEARITINQVGVCGDGHGVDRERQWSGGWCAVMCGVHSSYSCKPPPNGMECQAHACWVCWVC
jgi:ubiquitin-like modifier-activating enzyme 5